MRKILLLLSLAISLEGISQCITLTSQNGNSYVFTASTAQAYYWSTSAGAYISGSNTGQTVTVIKTGSCPVISVTRFVNGECVPCSYQIQDYHIEEDELQICISESAPNFKRRGLYTLLDCNNNPVQANWTILEGTTNFTVVNGSNTAIYHIIPKYQWMIGYNYTVQAFHPTTGVLLAQYVITIQDCDACSTCRSFNYAPGSGQLIFNTDKEGLIAIELIDPSSGAVVATWNRVKTTSGKNQLDLRNSVLRKDKLYMVRISESGKETLTGKIVY